MGLLEKFAKVRSDVVVEEQILPALGEEPAYIVYVHIPTDKAESDAFDENLEGLQLNTEKHRLWWGKTIVTGWTGLTFNNARRLIPGLQLDEEATRKTLKMNEGDEIPYRPQLAADLNQWAPKASFARPINDRVNVERERILQETQEMRTELQKN